MNEHSLFQQNFCSSFFCKNKWQTGFGVWVTVCQPLGLEQFGARATLGPTVYRKVLRKTLELAWGLVMALHNGWVPLLSVSNHITEGREISQEAGAGAVCAFSLCPTAPK